MRQRILILLMLLPLLLFSSAALAEWRVDFESKTVNPNDVGVTVDVTVYWDLPMSGFTVPVVVRQNSPGAFWTGTLPYDTSGNGYWHPYSHGVTWSWQMPWASLIEEFRPGVPTGLCDPEGDVGYDGVSPDHFAITASSSGMMLPAQSGGWVALTFSFDVTGTPGTFEFDTACFSSSLFKIFMIDDASPPINHGFEATFNKGVITIFGETPNEPPEITCPGGGTYDIGQQIDLAISATDDGNPDPPGEVAFLGENVPDFLTLTNLGGGNATLSGTPDCDDPGEYTIRMIAVDGELADTCFIVVTVNEDNEPPVITCPANVTIDCAASTDPANTGSATATDNCDPSPAITYTDSEQAGSCPAEKVITRTWTATDATGNSTQCFQTITVTDDVAPVLAGCPGDVTAECDAVPDPAQVTATDNCDQSVDVIFDEVSNLTGCGDYTGTITRTWTATDDCGNEISCTQIITVVDNTAPILAGCPGDVTVECDAIPDPAQVTATDNCDQSVEVIFNEVSDLTGCGNYTGTITRTWTATDDCGNESSCTQTITVQDNTAPLITCPEDFQLACGESSDPSNTGSATATDNCDANPVITYTDQPGTGSIIRTWTATDACGNEASCDQTITTIDDTTPPVITCPGDVTIDCTASIDPANTGSATATDDCDPNPAITFVDEVTGNCPQDIVITRTWTATDANGNFASCVQTITVIDDAAPVLAGCPGDVTVECDAIPDPANVTATDNCDPDPEVIMTEIVALDLCGDYTGTITRTWTATDDCGNEVSCTQIITVEDNTDPVLAGCPGDVTVECDAIPDPAQVTATDNCDQSVEVIFNEVSDLTGCGDYTGTITRTWTATDDCGNEVSCTQIITVEDNTDPVLAGCPGDVTIECSDQIPDPAQVTATDNCDQNVEVIFNEVVDLTGCGGTGTITRTWTATDLCGNGATCTQIITVVDETDPVITCPPDLTIDPGDPTDPSFTGTATATDNCGGDPVISYSDVIDQNIITRTWLAVDDCGNDATCTQIITIDVPIDCRDSCWVGHEIGAVGSTVSVPIYFKNCVDLSGISLPLKWDPDVVTLESVDFTGSRVSHITLKSGPGDINNADNNVWVYALVVSESLIEPGEGLLATLNFHIDECSTDLVIIDTAYIPDHGYYEFTDATPSIVPTEFSAGSITIEGGEDELILDPESFVFEYTIGGALPDCQTLSLDNEYCGPIGWALDWDASWLSVIPDGGTFPGQAEVCIRGSDVALTVGTYTDSICVRITRGPAKSASLCPCEAYVPVTLIVTEEIPLIRLTNGSFKFDVSNGDCDPGPETSTTFSLTNAGTGTLNWSATWKESWLSVLPDEGTAPSEIEVTVSGACLAAETYTDTITITANAINSPQLLIVEMTVTDCPRWDTVWVEDGSGALGEEVIVPVNFSNSGPLSGVSVPLKYSSDAVRAVSADFAGSRVEYLNPAQRIVTIDEVERTICIAAVPFSEPLIPAGSGLLVNLHFMVESDQDCPLVVGIDSNFIEPGCELMFADECLNSVYPEFFAGQIEILCPGGICGIIEDEGGQGIDACPEAWDSYPDGNIIGTGCAGEDGHFCIDVPDGCYDVRIRNEGYCPAVIEDVCSPTDMGVIVLTAIDLPIITPYVADYWGSAPTLRGEPLIEGDVITAIDPDGVTCGVGYVNANGGYLIHVYGDDVEGTPGIDEGAEDGDLITFLLNCYCLLDAENLWENLGSFNEELDFQCERRQDIPLCGDWTLISYNVSVEDQSLENVLSSIAGEYDQIISSTCEDGAITWDINRPPQLNDLNEMDNEHGYWLYAPGADVLTIWGTPVPPNTPLELCEDWNVISYLPNQSDNLLHAWASIAGEYEYAMGFDCELGAQTYDPKRPAQLNDLTCLNPGYGYWVKMYNASTLTYPTSGYGCEPITILPKSVNLTDKVVMTPWVCDFWSTGNADGPAEGAVLTARDEDGTICGQSMVLEGGMFLVHVYGDNPFTERDEGATRNSRLTFSIDDAEFEVFGGDTWFNRGSIEITLNKSGNTAPVPAAFELSQNYPNPFNPNTTIRFRMPDDAHVQLSVYNVLGQRVRTLVDEFYAAGEHEVEWDGFFDNGSAAESGIYFYRISTATFTDVRKMTLLK